jgi:predicted RNase H-like HicB family nuclease
MDKPLLVHAEWDDEAGVWVATSDDVPGLVTESKSIEALMVKLESMIPDLFEANDLPMRTESFEIVAHRRDRIKPAA